MLKDKNILLGVCGSIASYKSAELVRLFVKAGANVKVVMTQEATEFITPLTLSTLSKNPVLYKYFKAESGEWNNHVELGIWADLMIVAPATANSIAKFANGLCDNLLSAVYLSAKCKVYIAPAMDFDMWKHSSTQSNISSLIGYGNKILKPKHGELASGLVGEGRLPEPHEIFDYIADEYCKILPLANKKALVTAGPTYESIDPVRFIGNHSSGKMGYAIANELANLGAEVTLVSGPTSLNTPHPTIKRIDVISTDEMFNSCEKEFIDVDICVMSAAVADYTPIEVATQKIKKSDSEFTIKLKKTKDILFNLGKQKKKNQLLVGFALETYDEHTYAIQKLQSKNLDFIVLNSLNDNGAGFKNDTNKITIIDKDLIKTSFELKEKSEVAKDICDKIVALL